MTTTKKFNAKSATLTEFNRELKRLASRKCRAKSDEDREAAVKEYERLAALKAEKFASVRKSYITMTDEEIAQCDLETAVKAIKSLQSRRCTYPSKKAETLAVEVKFIARKEELTKRALLERLTRELA